MFYVYAIWNKDKNKIYIGQTANLEERLKRHNNLLKNKATSFTNINRGAWVVVYKENFNERNEAIRREKELKSFKGREFIRKLISK